MVWKERCYYSQRRQMPAKVGKEGGAYQTEHVAVNAAARGTPTELFVQTSTPADYLDFDKRSRGSPYFRASAAFDAGVGFASSKGDANMTQAMRHLGHGHVSSVWAYQGSKPFVTRGRLYSGLGDTLHCADPFTKDVFWKQRLRDEETRGEILDSMLTPPAIANGKLFVGSIEGYVYCLRAESGDLVWKVKVGEPVVFQPAVVKGRVYAPTWAGTLFCLETGDGADDGWSMWGATAAHNGLPE